MWPSRPPAHPWPRRPPRSILPNASSAPSTPSTTRAAEAGVQWERLIFPWSLIQKTGPNAWNDGYLSDQQIAQEAARGIQIVGLATYTPQWASSTPQNPKP